MPNGTFRNGQVTLRAITHADIPAIQDVLDHAPHYHTSIVGVPPAGLAARAFAASPPDVKGSRVFRYFMAADDTDIHHKPAAAIDLFVGFPSFKIASLAMLVIREDAQRKGLGRRRLTSALPAFIRHFHPAVESLSVSLTDNNVPALRCLLACKFERTNQWEKIDALGRTVTALTYRRKIDELIQNGIS